MHDLQCWYKVLELEPGASLEEVNQAHKDLALVWHPDRLPKDSTRLQEKAEAKLKEINHARDRLREHKAVQSNSHTPATAQRQPAQPSPSPPAPPASEPQYYQKARVAEQYSYPHAQATRKTNRQSSKTTNSPPSQRLDLSGQDLSGKDLSERDFSNRNLSNANLSNANLKDSFLHDINLSGANLFRANLFRANLLHANLSNANLREANLIGADLSGANLSGADLTGAQIEVGTKMMVRLMGANLTGAIMPNGRVHA
jgi:uncharacterized protein YjbI with pentapeptide repeats